MILITYLIIGGASVHSNSKSTIKFHKHVYVKTRSEYVIGKYSVKVVEYTQITWVVG